MPTASRDTTGKNALASPDYRALVSPGDRCMLWQNLSKAVEAMSTMNISLPDALKSFVDEQVSKRGFSTSSEYVRELIRKDQDLQHLRGLLLAGAESPLTEPVDDDYFESLRAQARQV